VALKQPEPEFSRPFAVDRLGKTAVTETLLAGPAECAALAKRMGIVQLAQLSAVVTLERTLADLGVTPPQFIVLTMLKAYPGLSGADLARIALLTPQTVGVIIRNLQRDGSIRKTPHPVHGRVQQWTLTRRGQDLLVRCRRRALALERRLAADLSATGQATVRRWLSKIATDLQQDI